MPGIFNPREVFLENIVALSLKYTVVANRYFMFEQLKFITGLPGLILVKNRQSQYVFLSQDFAHLLGWKDASDGYGKTDYELPCKAAKFATQFIQNDQKVMRSNKKMVSFDVQNYSNGWKPLLIERTPLQNKTNECVGLFLQGFDISEISFFKIYLSLYHVDKNKFYKELRPISYILTDSTARYP